MENQTDQLMLALMEVHKEFGVVIKKDRKGNRGTYASLPCVLESIHEMCHKHGLILTQESCIYDGKNALKTILHHPTSKQQRSSVSLLTAHPEPQSYDQAWGGSSTYHRRYDAMMIMGIFADQDPTDNDGNYPSQKKSYAASKTTSITPSSATINQQELSILKMELKDKPELEALICKTLQIEALHRIPESEYNRVRGWVRKKLQEQ